MPRPVKQVVIVIQARLGSQRLPNKVMRPILGEPVLTHLVRRVRAARLAQTIVVATTTLPEDAPITTLCKVEGILCFRGHPTDLLDRHYRAGRHFDADAVVKIPSDCVLVDPQIIDRVLSVYLADPDAFDFISNLHPQSYPDGNDVELMSMAALAMAWREAKRGFEREHTTPFLWENPNRFRLHNVAWETGLDYSLSHRWVLDYEADFQFIKAVYEALYPINPLFGLSDILRLLETRPDLAALNADYAGVNWYRHHLDELKTISVEQTRLGSRG